ncbi:unnamed protein product [Dicrocoelium dendriticum]|nr:unnamed protein product [Dicrocoelium dendriticum]
MSFRRVSDSLVVQLKAVAEAPGAAGLVETELISIDEILESEVGSFGLWQRYLVLLGILSTTAASSFPVFSDTEPLKRCALDSETETFLKEKQFSFFDIGQITGGWTEDLGPHSVDSGCHLYVDWRNHLNSTFHGQSTDNLSTKTMPCQAEGYVYRYMDFQYQGGIVEEFNLVCDQVWLLPVGTSVFMVGMIFGYLFGGFWSARFGMKHSLIFFSFVELIASCLCSASVAFWMFTLLRLFVGIGAYGKLSSFNLIILDITTPRYRSITNALYLLGFNFTSRALLAAFAWGIWNWRWLNLAATIHCVLVFSYFFIVPESPRWLLARNQTIKAIYVLQTGRRINAFFDRKHKGDSSKLERLIEQETRRPSVMCISVEQLNEEIHRVIGPKQKSTDQLISKLFSTPYMLKTTVVSTLLFFLFAFTSLGCLLYTRMIRETVSVVSLIVAAVAIPGVIIAVVAYGCIHHRRLPLLLTYMSAAIVLCAGGVYTYIVQPEEDIALSASIIITIMLFTTLQCMMFIYIPELYPPDVRAQGFGTAAGLGRLGAAVATFANQLDQSQKHGLPVIIYAVAALVSGLITLLLSDTTGEEDGAGSNLRGVTSSVSKSNKANEPEDDSSKVTSRL